MITKELFGTSPQGDVEAYTISNTNGMAVTILTLGGIIQKLIVPATGKLVDVCLGYDTVEQYLSGKGYYGALIGRYANRIAGSSFSLDGIEYPLRANHEAYQIHGGPDAFDKKIWSAKATENSLSLRYTSADGENGFPGNLDTEVIYTLGEDNSFKIEYRAISDKDTVINLTNHTYFNLHGNGNVLNDVLWVDADHYTATDAKGIPTGQLVAVKGTPLDFTTPKPLGQNIPSATGCYDHNLCLNGEGFRLAAQLQSDTFTMQMYTDQPGVQVYCSAIRTPKLGKSAEVYEGWCFVCLETQNYPDAVHHPHFPNCVLRAAEQYHHTTIYKFI